MLYVALLAADPNDTDVLAGEITGGGYARQPLPAKPATIAFGPASERWGIVNAWAVVGERGDVIRYGTFAYARRINAKDEFHLPPGATAEVYSGFGLRTSGPGCSGFLRPVSPTDAAA